MNFIVDAQLPLSISNLLLSKGYNSIHTSELKDKNNTTDKQIIELSEKEDRIVITKDSDFLESYLVNNQPQKLILVRTGNIRNSELLSIFELHLNYIIEKITKFSLLEIHKNSIIVHV